MTDWDRVQRRVGEEALRHLEKRMVSIVGLGSLGSQTAVLLAMSGVGQFVLIDPDFLEETNVVRHACGLAYVGRPKVEAVRELILDRNPSARVKAIQADARRRPGMLKKADLVIVAGLGSEIAQQQMGILLRKIDRPALFGGAYEKAIAGEVLLVYPDRGPCYACFTHYLRETEPVVDHQVNYGLPPDEVRAQPGLGIDVIGIAKVVASWALRLLIDDPLVLKPFPGNLVILANEEYEIGKERSGKPIILPPASARWLNFEAVPGCLVCGLKNGSEGSIDNLLEGDQE